MSRRSDYRAKPCTGQRITAIAPRWSRSAGIGTSTACDQAMRSSNACPTSARAAVPTSSTRSSTAVARVPGVRAARLLVRPVAQPVGVHARGRRRRRSKAPSSRCSRPPSPAIDLRTHRGEHPRLGAVDVVPFIPIEGVTMDECVALAKETAAEVADAIRGAGVSSTRRRRRRPARRNLEDIRRGEFEGLAGEDGDAGVGARLRPARARIRPPARRSSARACRSSRTTSTWRPTGSTWRRRLPPPSATAAAGSAT